MLGAIHFLQSLPSMHRTCDSNTGLFVIIIIDAQVVDTRRLSDVLIHWRLD
jgi:hypothetical protein